MALTPVAALSDDWMRATTQVYTSPGGQVRLTVTPRDLETHPAWSTGRAAAGRRRGSLRNRARGLLERLGSDGRWTRLWDRSLVNDIAPVRAVVADSGRYAVTFDDWHAVGTGRNVVAIYGGGGNLVRSMTLGDILPDSYVAALPRTVSSIVWGGEHFIAPSGDTLILKVRVPSRDVEGVARFVELPLDLATGRPLPSAEPDWGAILAEALRVPAARADE